MQIYSFKLYANDSLFDKYAMQVYLERLKTVKCIFAQMEG